jgi:Protein of unknown function (DUF5131)
MSEVSTIEWTDATWNPVRGCTKISPGCKHCYAETFAERFRGVPGHPYEQGFDLHLARFTDGLQTGCPGVGVLRRWPSLALQACSRPAFTSLKRQRNLSCHLRRRPRVP